MKQAYNTTQRDGLSKVWSVVMLKAYLAERVLKIRTDQNFFKWILHLTEATNGLARRRPRFS